MAWNLSSYLERPRRSRSEMRVEARAEARGQHHLTGGPEARAMRRQGKRPIGLPSHDVPDLQNTFEIMTEFRRLQRRVAFLEALLE